MEGDQGEDEFNEDMDKLCPLNDQGVLEKIALQKKENPSKFVSYWEMDEEDVDEATEEEIQNNPVVRTLWAAEKDHLDILEEMLQKDSSLVNCVDSDGYTPLHRAAYEDNTTIVKYLLEHSAEIEKKTNDGWTALHSAAIWGQFTALSILLSHGADVNAQTNSKQTALHLAAGNNPDSRETLELLLMQPGCDFSIKNSVGETALELGRRCSRHHHLFEICEDSTRSRI